MRVSKGRVSRLQNERGAVAFIVAVSLFTMLALLVLTFDLGHVVAVRRDMVNASDAGALAAARECAIGHGLGQAEVAARTLVNDNRTGASVTYFSAPECDSLKSAAPKLVTVDSQTSVGFFFAEIFGFTSTPVAERAVALWGPIKSITSPVPIRIDYGALEPCISQTPPAGGDACTFAFNNDPVLSQWGILNFPEGWPTSGVGPPACNAAGGQSDVTAYIDGTGTPFTATVPEDPGYVYVCAQTGQETAAIHAIVAGIQNAAPDPFYLTFPVMSATQPVLDLGGNQEAVPVVGFTVLRVLGAWWGQEAKAHCTFSDDVEDSSLFCIQTQWDGGQIIPGTPGGGLDYGAEGVRLVE